MTTLNDHRYGVYRYGDVAGRGVFFVGGWPQVMTNLKRHFPQAKQEVNGYLALTANRAVARDLEWFNVRYPLDPLTPESADHLGRLAAEHRQTEDIVAGILAGRPATLLDGGERRPSAVVPRGYQEVVPHLLRATGGFLLGDVLGLGKTLEASLIFENPDALPAVVVVPQHLRTQWRYELLLYFPWLLSHIVKKGTPYDTSLVRGRPGPKPDILIISYGMLWGWVDHLVGDTQTLIFEEAHELRTGPKTASGGSRRYDAAAMLADKVRFRIGLTATAVYNYGDDIYRIMEVLRPGALGTRDEFGHAWGHGMVREPRALGRYLREEGLFLRRTRADVGRELPPVIPVLQAVETDHKLLDKMIAEGMAGVAQAVLAADTDRTTRFKAAGELDYRMRQATGVAKAPFVAEFVKLLLETEKKVVLCGWHREVYRIWLESLRDYRPVLYTGSETPSQKDANLKRFITGDSRVLVLSLRSGAGINGLQKVSRTVVFGEPDWSPGPHKQVIGRLDRDGQTEPVMAFYMVSDGGSDPAVFEVLDVKRMQAEPINDPDAALATPNADLALGRIKTLARDVLRRAGRAEPVPPPRVSSTRTAAEPAAPAAAEPSPGAVEQPGLFSRAALMNRRGTN